MLIDPVDRLRLDPRRAPGRRGLAGPAARRRAGARRPRRPTGARARRRGASTPSDVRFAYVEGRDVLHGVDLDVGPGERLAMVGPSGAGKSTLGRLLAGIHPPRTGSVTVGGVGAGRAAAGRPARPRRAGHPGAPRLRRHAAREPRAGRAAGRHRRRASARRSAAVDALRLGATRCPTGSTPWSAPAAARSPPAQAQQVALARLVLADPHTLVLDEATSLIDPRAARHLERSLAAVLRRPHGHRDRAPALLRARRRPGRGGRGRPDHRARLPRRAGRRRRLLRRAVGSPGTAGGWVGGKFQGIWFSGTSGGGGF